MCFSQTTSIISYTIGMLSVIFAICTQQYILGILILFFVQMQFSELLIWRGIDNQDKKLNQIGTSYGKFLLPTHNIAIGLGIILMIYMSRKELKLSDFSALLIGVLFYFYVLFFEYSDKDATETYPLEKCVEPGCQNSKNRLVWPYEHRWYFYSFLISLFLLFYYCSDFQNIKSQLFLSIFFISTFALTILLFSSHVVGSFWCFSAAIMAPLIVLGNHYFNT